MHLIRCPHCGHRDESEFVYGGPFSGRRPDDPGALDDEAWANYLTVPDNPAGPVAECWWPFNGTQLTRCWRSLAWPGSFR